MPHQNVTTKFCHSHAKRKFLHVQEKIPTTSCTNKFLHTQQNFSTISTKFCHGHLKKKKKFTHANKFSHIHHEHIHISQTQSFHNANTPKIPTKIHPTTSQITYIVKIPKATNIGQIAPWSKKKHTSRMLQSQHSKHDQSHNAPKISKVIISHCETFNETCNNIFFKQRNQRKNSHWCLHDNMEHGS